MFGYIVFAACFLLSVAVVYESVKGRRTKSVSARYIQDKIGNALVGHQDYVNPSIAPKETEKPSEKQPKTKDNCVYWYNATYLVWINHDGSVVFMNVTRLNESHLAPAPCGLVAADLKNYKQATDYVLVQDRPQFVNRHVVYADRDNQEWLYWIVGDRVMTAPTLSTPPRRFETVQKLLKAVDDQKLVLAGDYMLKEVDGTRRPVAKVYSYPVEGNTERRNICWWIGGWWDGSQWVDSRLHFCSLDTMHVIGTASSSRATFQASNRFTPTDEFVVVNGKPQRLKPLESEPGNVYCRENSDFLWWVEDGRVFSMDPKSSDPPALRLDRSPSDLTGGRQQPGFPPEFKRAPSWVLSRQERRRKRRRARFVPVNIDLHKNIYISQQNPDHLYFLDPTGQYYLRSYKKHVGSAYGFERKAIKKLLASGEIMLTKDYVVRNVNGELKPCAA